MLVFLAHCSTPTSVPPDGEAPDSSEVPEATLKDGTPIFDASVPDATGPLVVDATGAGTTDAGAVATDAGTMDATDAGGVEHVVPDGIYDCDVVQIRCNGAASCGVPQLASPDHTGVLFSFEMTVTGNTVVIPPDYACTGTWYPAGTPVDVLGSAFSPEGGGAGTYDRGGFACQFPTEQGMMVCDVGYNVCSINRYFVVEPTDPNPVRMNLDGGALQAGEIYVGLIGSNSYNAHCAPRH